MDLVIIKPRTGIGGVYTIFHNLYRGLVSDGHHVDVFELGAEKFRFLSIFYDDILNAKCLREQDLALYIGSIPWPSHMFARLFRVPTALFLHGYVYHELFHRILHERGLRNKTGAFITAAFFKIATSLNTVDLYICHSLSACEANKIPNNFVLLPQFVFPKDLELLRQNRDRALKEDDTVRVVAYTSSVSSPRLLNTEHLIALARIAKSMVKRKFEFIIVDPKRQISNFNRVKNYRTLATQRILKTFSFSGSLH